MNSQSSDKKWAYLALIVAFFAFSTSAILIRWSSSEPLVIGSYRQTFATLLFLPFLFKDRFKEITSLSLNETAELIVIGILLGAHFGFWISSVKATSVAASVLLGTCHIVYVAIIGWIVFGEKLNKNGITGTFFALFGIIILFWGDLVDDPGNFRGNFFAFISGILAGLYILGGRKHRKKISLPTYAFIVYFSSAITMWVVVLAQGLDYKSISKSEFQLFFVMALVPTLLGHTMQNWALAFLPAYVISITLLAEPVGSGILAWHLFDEVPSLGVLVGGLIVLFGVCLVALSEQDITLEDQS
jgi:drug/metabolite transporter (DMT)-like permease|tara:strand:+ start:49 stop:951 length:903 start_codon:yes stop_codon:yes gene_type:complete